MVSMVVRGVIMVMIGVVVIRVVMVTRRLLCQDWRGTIKGGDCKC